jgi:hypothetical protein
MLQQDDLDAAVAEGIVSVPQAMALRDFLRKREKQRAVIEGPEEHFRFMRGFNDFFLAIGVVLLGTSLIYFVKGSPSGSLAAAAGTWALAELLVGRMRLVLPGILLTCFFVMFIFDGMPLDDWFGPTPLPRQQVPQNWVALLFGGTIFPRIAPFAISLKALVAGVAALLFYARFRLPFALLPLAASIVLALVAASVPVFNATVAYSLVLLGCGVMVFAAAMAFDLSDRERVTRRSDCAFWLHLLAAPLIVHSLISLVTNSAFDLTNAIASAILCIIVVLTLIAITIDRRALLVSTLIYLGSLIGYAIPRSAIDQREVLIYTLAILGVMIVALGVGWLPLRRSMLAILPSFLVALLPPVPVRA